MSIEDEPETEAFFNEIDELREIEEEPERKCIMDLDNGELCRVPPLRGESLCLNHSGTEAAQRIRRKRIANSIAARRLRALETKGDLGSTQGLRRVAVKLIRGLAEGSFDTARARAITAVMRLLETDMRGKERHWQDIDRNWEEETHEAGEGE